MTAYAQPSETKLAVDREDYKSLLITANIVADKLELKIQEIELLNEAIAIANQKAETFKQSAIDLVAKNNATIEGINFQLERMQDYAKHLKKRITRAWINGLWQGAVAGVAIIFALLLL